MGAATAGRVGLGIASGAGMGALAGVGINQLAGGGLRGSLAGGIGGGAVAGAMIGSAIPGLGTITGAIAGATLGGLVQGFRHLTGSKSVSDAADQWMRALNERTRRGAGDGLRQAVMDAERAQRALQEAQPFGPRMGATVDRVELERRRRALREANERLGREATEAFIRGSEGTRFHLPRTFARRLIETMRQLPPEAQKQAAATVFRFARQLEKDGRLPRGGAARVVKMVRAEFATLERDLPRSGERALRAYEMTLRTEGVARRARMWVNILRKNWGEEAPKIAHVSGDNIGRAYERMWSFLDRMSRTGSDKQQREAQRLSRSLQRDIGASVGHFSRLAKRYKDLPPEAREMVTKQVRQFDRLRSRGAIMSRDTRKALADMMRDYRRYRAELGVSQSGGVPRPGANVAGMVQTPPGVPNDPFGVYRERRHTGGVLPGGPRKRVYVAALGGERFLTRHQTAVIDRLLGRPGAVDAVIRAVRRHHSFDVGGQVTADTGAPTVARPRIAGGDGFAAMGNAAINRIGALIDRRLAEDAARYASMAAGANGIAAPKPQVMAWLTRALRITGHYSPANLAALYGRAMQESGGNPRAINLWDSNARAGIPSKGLLQTIEPTFRRYALPGMTDIWNPVHNAVAAIRYMMARYGRIVGPGPGGYDVGGVVPQDGTFDRGGAVAAAMRAIHRFRGQRYVYGTRDCSTFVSSVIKAAGYTGPSGSTAVLYKHSTPARGTEPIIIGLRKTHGQSGYIGGPQEHVGVRVGGTWYDFAPGVGLRTGQARWMEFRVPKGLARLAREEAEWRGARELTGFEQARALFEAAGFPIGRGRRAVTQAAGGAGAVGRLTGASSVARRVIRAAQTVGFAGERGESTLSPAQQRAIGARGRQVRIAGRAAGEDPDVIEARARKAETKFEIEILQRMGRRNARRINNLRRQRAKVVADWRSLAKRKGLRPGAKKAAARRLRIAMDQIKREIDELREMNAEISARINELGDQLDAEAYAETFRAQQDAGEGGDTWADADARREQAEREAAAQATRAAAAGAIVETIAGAGSIAPGVGIDRPIIVNIEGNLVTEGQLAGWLSEVLARQPARPASTYHAPL